MTRDFTMFIFVLVSSNLLIILLTTQMLSKKPTSLIHHSDESNATACIHNVSDIQRVESDAGYTVCSSLSNYAMDVPSTTRIHYKDGTSAFVSNTGWINGVSADGGTGWYVSDMINWEHTTFLMFRALIKPDMVYVGFGEWIGPTILYSAQLAKASYGFEPDIIAFRSLALNAKANQCFGDRLRVFSMCIYMHFGELILKDATGGSVSSIVDDMSSGPAHLVTGPTTSVRCVTLEHVLSNHSLLNERLFLKVDTEGAEALLVPSLVPLIHKLKHRPTWFLSKHQNSRYAEPHVQQGFRELTALYKCHRYSPASHQTWLTREQMLNFKVSSLPSIDDIVVSDPNSNPDLILVDEDCTTVDKWIQEVVHLFVNR